MKNKNNKNQNKQTKKHVKSVAKKLVAKSQELKRKGGTGGEIILADFLDLDQYYLGR